MVEAGMFKLPDKPAQPAIVPGDYLSLHVGSDKDLKFKTINARNDSSERPMIDPAGYIPTAYDQQLIKYLAGQVMAEAFKDIKLVSLDATNIDTIQAIKESGYYYLTEPITKIDPQENYYVEAHFRDSNNGIALIMGTVYFYTLDSGTWSDLKGGETNGTETESPNT